MNKFGISRNNIIAILFATCIFIPVGAVSIGSILGGFRVGAFKTEIDAHTICKQVSANDGEEYFIGTKTEQEWESVHDNTNIPS